PLLSDPKSIIIKAFDLHHDGYAHPMILIIDTEGKIIKRFSASHYSERPSVVNVLKSLASNK
ncbi:MAG: peroxiredoxin family protein, partial [Rhodospirillales bacterium]